MMRAGLADSLPPSARHRLYAEGYADLFGEDRAQTALHAMGSIDIMLAVGIVVGVVRHIARVGCADVGHVYHR